MAKLLQSQNAFAKYLVWCGVCTDESDAQFDLTSTDKVLQVLEFSASGTVVKVYDTTLFESFWDFKKLKIGHAYLITLKKGKGELDIPNVAVSFSESTAKNKITTECKPAEPTPTPTPTSTPTPTQTPEATPTPFDCCSGMKSVTLNNDKDGVSLQVEGEKFKGGQLCYALKNNSEILPGNSIAFYAKDKLGNFIATIAISAKEGISAYKGFDSKSSGRFVYRLPNGDCYEGDLQWATPNDYGKGPVFTKIDAEQAIEMAAELLYTPTSANYYIMTPTPMGSGLNPNIDLSSDGYESNLLSAGKNTFGQLASEFGGSTFNPSLIPAYSVFSANEDHFVYLKYDNTLWGGGLARDGQLGDSPRFETEDSYEGTLEQITDKNLENIRDVVTTKSGTFVVKTDDTVWGLGKNVSGEMGTNDPIGTITKVAKQLQISDALAFIKPSNAPTDNSTLYIVDQNGDVYGSGFNGNNNLFLGSSQSNYLVPTKTTLNDSELVSICLTDSATLILKTDGCVYATGDIGTNGVGGLGKSSAESTTELIKIENCVQNNSVVPFEDIIQIYSNGKDAVVALKADGSVFTWGVGEDILGVGTISNYTDDYSILDEDDYSSRGRTIPTQVSIADVKYVSMSRRCCFALKYDGSMWTWGTGANNENGLNDTSAKFSPTKVEFDTFLAVSVESVIPSSFTNYVKLESS